MAVIISNYGNGDAQGLSPGQAAQALLAEGFIFDFEQCAQGRVCLHNDADIAYFISEEHIEASIYYGAFNADSLHDLAACRLGQNGQLILGPAQSIEIQAFNLAPNAPLCIKRG